MVDRGTRIRDLQNQLHQLDREARGSALTPGEAEKNGDQRNALRAELRDLGEPGQQPDARHGGVPEGNVAG